MKYIIGLGNPGFEYEKNRHNIGFLFLDFIAEKAKCAFVKEKNYHLAKTRTYALIKPQTYMNNSGIVVKSLINEQFNDIIIVVDDINLPFGSLRIREQGGDGGHNGLKSIIENINSDNFTRIRIGVGSPENKKLSDYVLEDFSQDEFSQLNDIFDFAYNLIKQFIHRDYQTMLNYYSKNKRSYSERFQDDQNQRPKEENK
ncbi:MAG TPA: aminoacyl-tRNA hydrolase [Candidatus Cloacimonadota bacterium]|nr:aminoacyl-tRNA hydrolase [Candidatus Cloacimonadota bacterium]HOQ80037.1 aminoacyl-tRNA hydrolase [Candidatus Cloacimonadota bacterium]HPK40086.1 aminoacyl-tRNA hydrolase [Candidatus Cloacimonadota bacterium]